MPIKTIKEASLTWINIENMNDEAVAFLKENYHFHHLDIGDLHSEGQTPKIDVYKNYLFLILQFPQWRAETKTVVRNEIDIFVGEGYLVTIERTKSKEMKNFFYRCMNNRMVKQEWMSNGAGFLLFQLLNALYHNCRPILNHMGKNLSALEEEVFDKAPDINVVKQLAGHRRNVLSFRRIIDPQKYLMATLSHTRKPFLDETMSLYFDDVHDYLLKLWAITDTYKDTIDGLHVTVESLINQKTNRVISALTTISVSLLPLTLFSGLYGMNIPLPFAGEPLKVWAMFGTLAAVIVIFILAMKKNKRF